MDIVINYSNKQLRALESSGNYSLVTIDNDPQCKNANIHDNSQPDTFEPSVISSARLRNGGATQWGTSEFSGIINNTRLVLSGLQLSSDQKWFQAENGWAARLDSASLIYNFDEYSVVSDSVNALNPCSSWTVVGWGYVLSDSPGVTVGHAPSGISTSITHRWMDIGNISIDLQVNELVYEHPSTTVRTRHFYAGGGISVKFPCGTFSAQTINSEKILGPKSISTHPSIPPIGCCVSYDASTKTIEWSIGTPSGIFIDPSGSGTYLDKFGYGGRCDKQLLNNGANVTSDTFHTIGIRKIQISHSTLNPSGTILAGP